MNRQDSFITQAIPFLGPGGPVSSVPSNSFFRFIWNHIGIIIGIGLTLGLSTPGWADEHLLRAVEEEIATLMEQNRSCVVSIHTITREEVDLGKGSEAGVTMRRNVGSGVIFDTQGHILTTAEVVRDANYIQVSTWSGEMVDADLVATDEDSKVAVLQLHGEVSRCPRLGDSDRVRTGHYAFIIGNAWGTMAPSVGSVVEFRENDDMIQISGSARPGNSGAAVFNSEGQVIGLIRGVLSLPPSDAGEISHRNGFGWNNVDATLLAIPINRARRVAQDLIDRRGWLGLEVERHGTLRITRVEEDGPAEDAGFQVGDEVILYREERVIDGEHLARLVVQTPEGNWVTVGIQRDRQPISIRVRIGHQPRKDPGLNNSHPFLAYDSVPASGESQEDLLKRVHALKEQNLHLLKMLIQEREGRGER